MSGDSDSSHSDQEEWLALEAGIQWLSPRGEALAKLAAVGALGLYVLGFVVAVLHYSRYGVSPLVLQYQTIVAAGISLLVSLVPGFLLGRKLKHVRGRVVVAGNIVVLVGIVLLVYFIRRSRIDPMGLLGLGLFSFITANLGIATTRNSLNYTALAAILSVLAYPFTVYPNFPWPGGSGAPTLVHAFALPETEPPAIQDQWLKLGCRGWQQPTEGKPACRRVYLIYETADHVYVELGEWDGRCPRTDSVDEDHFSVSLQSAPRRCSQRIANALVDRLEIPPSLSAK